MVTKGNVLAPAHHPQYIGAFANGTLSSTAKKSERFPVAAVRHPTPLAITMAGGCGKNLQDTVAIHLQTISFAANHAQPASAGSVRSSLQQPIKFR